MRQLTWNEIFSIRKEWGESEQTLIDLRRIAQKYRITFLQAYDVIRGKA